MKKVYCLRVAVVSALVFMFPFAAYASGQKAPKVKIVELENKGTSMNVPAPDWIKNYTANGISAVQKLYKDVYCIIGEESGVNKQFVLTWADNFSAQQRIGAMLRTNIASEYQARVTGMANSTGGANSSTAQGGGSGEYKQEIDSTINAIVNVSYSGAQREADWWSLRRRYDPDQKNVYSDEYTAYVMYTIPKAELNRQVAQALETAVSKDSALYDITISMAKQILESGMASWLEPPPPAASSTGSSANAAASAAQGGSGSGQDYNPRIRATEGGVPIDMYIARAEYTGGFLLVYLTTKDLGDMPSDWWGYGWNSSSVILRDLDKGIAWNAARWSMTTLPPTNGPFLVLSFENVSGNRFSLTRTDRSPNSVFTEFVVSGK